MNLHEFTILLYGDFARLARSPQILLGKVQQNPTQNGTIPDHLQHPAGMSISLRLWR